MKNVPVRYVQKVIGVVKAYGWHKRFYKGENMTLVPKSVNRQYRFIGKNATIHLVGKTIASFIDVLDSLPTYLATYCT